MVHSDGKQNYQSFIFWRTYSDCWHFSGYVGEHFFAPALCPYGNNFLVRWCTTSLLQSCLWLFGQGISWLLGRKREETYSLVPSFSRLDSRFFLLGVCKKILFIMKRYKMLMSSVTESSQLQSTLPMKCLVVSGEKLNIILMCVMALIVPLLRSTEHIRNVMRSSVWKYVSFSITLYGWRYIMFYIIAI
jgi:hypothetical protein